MSDELSKLRELANREPAKVLELWEAQATGRCDRLTPPYRRLLMTMSICVKNQSTVLTDAEVIAAIPSFQKQVSIDFKDAWDLDATLTFLAKDSPVPKNEALIVTLDSSDQAGALGYHDVQASGDPIGKVFAGTTMQYGGKWSVTFSHELLELLADPFINLLAFNDRQGRIYAYEVCDAVEADGLGYLIDGVPVSDFVLPRYFDEHVRAGRLSCRGNVTQPFQLAAGGYMSYLDLRSGQWKQITARREIPEVAALTPDAEGQVSEQQLAMQTMQKEIVKSFARAEHDAIPRVGSRRERRARGKDSWIVSTAI